MPEIDPFKAYRFTCSNTELKEWVCPPYDVIPPALEKKLQKKRVNAIHIELPKGSPTTKYKNAQKIWETWVKKGIVKEEDKEAIYLYEQTFTTNGKKFSRRGFFCALKLEIPGGSSVLRHELTLAKPKEDRMSLLNALNVNTSPIFGIFQDPKKVARNLFQQIIKKQPQVNFTDREKIVHKMWVVSNPKEVGIIKNLVQKEPVLIADGHHRYETAWSYSKDHPNLEGARSALFFLSPVGDTGLVVFPTHRILLKEETLEGFLALMDKTEGCFQYKEIENIRASFQAMSPYHFIVSNGKKHYLIYNSSLIKLKKLIPGKSIFSLQHPLVQIHSLLLSNYQKEDCIYVQEYEEAIRLAKKMGKLTLIVPPTSIEHMYKIVQSGEVMPQKSTYFYPKIWSGLLFRSLI